jgi:hypothetical protein
MSDLLAGTTVKALDTPATVTNAQAGSFTFTITTFGVAIAGGTYADCGVAFVAPTTGRVMIFFDADLSNSTTTASFISPVVRTGGTVGSGSTVAAASLDEAIHVAGTNGHHFGNTRLITGLTAGTTYNVRLEHRVGGASTGTALRRHVTVVPAT